MKKRIFALILALVLTAALAACTGKTSVEGTWSLNLSGTSHAQNFSGLIGTSSAELYIISIVFNENGYYLADVGSVHGDHVHDAEGDASGKYTVEENTITFDGKVSYQYSVSGSTLTLTDENGNTFSYTK